MPQRPRRQQIHSNPVTLLAQLPAAVDHNRVSLANDVPLSREIIVHGLSRLARQNPDKAYYHWQRLKPAYQFDSEQQHAVQREIGLWLDSIDDREPLGRVKPPG